MDFSKINKVGRLEDFLPTQKISELQAMADYQITGMRKCKTKFGERVTVDVDGEVTVFLPARIAKTLNEDNDMFQTMLTACEEKRLQMRYLGGSYNQVEFKYV